MSQNWWDVFNPASAGTTVGAATAPDPYYKVPDSGIVPGTWLQPRDPGPVGSANPAGYVPPPEWGYPPGTVIKGNVTNDTRGPYTKGERLPGVGAILNTPGPVGGTYVNRDNPNETNPDGTPKPPGGGGGGGYTGAGADSAGQAHYDQFANYGYGNFTPGAQEQSNYFNQLAQWQAKQQAPQLGRTSIDWSGYGPPGQGYASQPMGTNGAGMPALPPGMGGSGPPPSPVPIGSGSGGSAAPGQFIDKGPVNLADRVNVAGATGRIDPNLNPQGPAAQPGGPGSFGGAFGGGGGFQSPYDPQGPSGGNTFNPGGPMGTTGGGPTGGGMSPMMMTSNGGAPVGGATLGDTMRDALRAQNGYTAPDGSWVPPTNPGPSGGMSPMGATSGGGLGGISGGVAKGMASALATTTPPPPAPQGGGYPAGVAVGGPGIRGTGQMNTGQTALNDKPANTPANQNFTQPVNNPEQPRPPGAPPGPMGPGGIPAVGQFANPVFQQGQAARQMQMGYLNRLEGDMSGRMPSAAQAQLAAGMTQGINAQASGAASAAGGGYGLAARTAAMNAANMQSQAGNQAAILKAQEYQAARDAYGAGVGGMRGQDITSAGQSYQNAIQEAQFAQSQNQSQADLETKQRMLNQMGTQADYGNAMNVQGQDLASRMHYMDLMSGKAGLDFNAYNADRANSNQMLGTGLETVGTVIGLAGLLSDERVKEGIAPANDDAISEFLGELKPKTFRYKNPAHGAGEHVGIMAQDAKKSKLGQLIVMQTPEGLALDMRKTMSALLAAGAHHEKRLRSLEATGKKPMGRAA